MNKPVNKKSHYRYPDINDFYVNNYVKNESWDDGALESKYIDNTIQQILDAHKTNILLDAGCGTGRWFPKFEKIFKKIVAIDPDYTRLQAAQDFVFQSKLNQLRKHAKFEFICSNAQDFVPDYMFDCVICSHIIQHICTNTTKSILKNFNKILKKDGFLIIITTNSLNKTDTFLKTDILNDKHCWVSEEEFNKCVEENKHYLPTRFFPEDTLKQLLQNYEFEIVFLKKHHGYPKRCGDNFVLARKL